MTTRRALPAICLPVVLALFLATPSAAQFSNNFAAWIDGAYAVPPTASPVDGGACILHLSSGDMFNYTFFLFPEPLSPIAAVTLNGPALPGFTAPVLFTLSLDTYGVVGPISPAQIAELKAGLWYINVQTVDYPTGEVRGQVFEILGHVNPCTLPVEEKTWGYIKSMYR